MRARSFLSAAGFNHLAAAISPLRAAVSGDDILAPTKVSGLALRAGAAALS
jgi:hypothetical protein